MLEYYSVIQMFLRIYRIYYLQLPVVQAVRPYQTTSAIYCLFSIGVVLLCEWHDTERRTIYRWLMELDTDERLAQAPV